MRGACEGRAASGFQESLQCVHIAGKRMMPETLKPKTACRYPGVVAAGIG